MAGINADYLDKSYLHSVLASRLMRQSGQPCFEAEPARLFVNGKFLGLYIRVENVDSEFLMARGLNPEGNLYKAARDGACLSVYDELFCHWEKKTNKKSAWLDLAELIRNINAVPDSDYYQFTRQNFDYQKMVNIIAMNMLLANGSTYYHNYYLFRDRQQNKWIVFPWDLDLTFHLYGENYPYHRSSGYGVPDNPLLERAILCQPIFDDIQDRIQQLAGSIFNPEFIFPIMDSLESLLSLSVQQDTCDDVADTTEWQQVIARDRDFIANRCHYLQNQFQNYPASFRIDRAVDVFNDRVTLSWHPSIDPNGDQVTYSLKYSNRKYFKEAYTISYRGIKDTVFTLPTVPADGTYFWLVSANDGSNSVDGFDSWNKFVVYSQSGDLVVFNEINYNSAADFDPKDWVELHNPHDFEINMTGWIFKDGDDAHGFRFPDQTIIKPHGYLVICRKMAKFQSLFPGVTAVVGDFEFGLSSDGELIRLYDRLGTIIDSLTYLNRAPWPHEADGSGATLELLNPYQDNSIASNWSASTPPGTPGRRNGGFTNLSDAGQPVRSFWVSQNYPNPFNQETNITVSIPAGGMVHLKIYNILGQLVARRVQFFEQPGRHIIRWQARRLGSGIYFYRIEFEGKISPLTRAILLK